MISVQWTKHLSDPDRKEDFEKTVLNNTLLFQRMHEILNEWEYALYSEERTKSQYEIPSWPVLQGHRNGNLETIQKVRDLITFKKELS